MGGDVPLPILGDQPIISEPPPRPSFAQRIQRAHDLSERYPAAGELLRFYAGLAFHQQHIFDSLTATSREPAGDDWVLLSDELLPLFSGFLRSLAGIAPVPTRDRALELASAPTSEQANLLSSFWSGGFSEEVPPSAGAGRFIALAFLQPYAEWRAQSGSRNPAASGDATCIVCGGEPLCAVLRDQDHGARRSLVCSLCMQEWSFLRVRCPACGEDRFEALPVFTPQEVPQVRVDACETCKHYIKTIDMTKDGLAVPVVDELASVSLDLWAAEKGYRKLTPNLAGL